MVKKWILQEVVTCLTEVRGLVESPAQIHLCDVNHQPWIRRACVGGGRTTSVWAPWVDGMKPKMEETLASHSEPKWHESHFIFLLEVSQQQAWRTAVRGGATRTRKYLE